MSSTFQPTIALDSTLGAVFLGATLTGILYGITCVQSYTYFKNNNRDKRWFKGTISLLWFLDTLHQALIAQNMYISLVSDFGNYDFLVSSHSNRAASGFFYVSEISDVIIRGIFGWRVWISMCLTQSQRINHTATDVPYLLVSQKNIPIAVCIAATSLLSFASVLAFLLSNFNGELAFFLKVSYLLYMGLASGMAADVFIAVFLCVNLWRRRSGLRKTNSLVKTLMMYSINTALLTTISYMACLITYAAMNDNFVWLAIYEILPKLFLNSLLALLNSRDALSEKGGVLVVSSSGDGLSAESNGQPGKSNMRHNRVVTNDSAYGESEYGESNRHYELPNAV
ncbi:hypothetical protein H2248_003737 [Termitomyces sp. 'cryptogamus']|nr:hypothetical protein H2248_003737 [Termitomyces sp. 'cryptogamus']